MNPASPASNGPATGIGTRFTDAVWQALGKAAALTAPIRWHWELGHASSERLGSHDAFEAQVAFAHVMTLLGSGLNQATEDGHEALLRAATANAGHDGMAAAEDLLKVIPSAWGYPNQHMLFAHMVTQLHRFHLKPVLGLSPLLNSATGKARAWTFEAALLEAMVNLWADQLYQDEIDLQRPNRWELEGSVQAFFTAPLAASLLTYSEHLNGGTRHENVRETKESLLYKLHHLLLRYVVQRHAPEGLERHWILDPPEPRRLLIDAQNEGFRAGVTWWLDARKTATGEAQSLFGFTHVTSKMLRLREWQPRWPALPCYVADSDLRYAVCSAAAEHLRQQGYTDVVPYHRYD